MTKKDFIRLAAIVKAVHERDGYDSAHYLALELADLCAEKNKLFNKERFLTACGVSIN